VRNCDRSRESAFPSILPEDITFDLNGKPVDYVEPKLLSGKNQLNEVLAQFRAPLVVSAPEPWGWLQRYHPSPRAARMVDSADLAEVEATEGSLPSGDAVIGIGGGTAVDNAKYVAWKRQLPLITMPSVISVDAFLTDQAAIRDEGLVRYVGNIWPETVILDHDLIRSGPVRLNRAGAADVLSIHTALVDWRIASEDREESYSPEVAQEALEILVRLELAADEIREITPAGINKLVELLSAEVRLCSELGSARPEEGSEHLFAYNFEKLTGKRMIHGELVGTGIFMLSRLQRNDPQGVATMMDKFGIRYRPSPEDATREDLRQTLLTLEEFVATEKPFYSRVNRGGLDADRIDAWLDELYDSQPDS
jgi:glycerol dehydrogenase-like iron-containing ADH family enzyme